MKTLYAIGKLITISVVAIALVVVGNSLKANAADPTYETIEIPGASITLANGINGGGQIVGVYMDATGTHGFLRNADGSFAQPIDFPGASSTVAAGINGGGQIVGSYFESACSGECFLNHGFLRNADGTFAPPIDFPGASSTLATGINGAGQIVGSYQDNTGVHGFLRNTDGSFAQPPIDFPGASYTYPFGINDAGQVVGRYVDATGWHGFLAAVLVDKVEFVGVSDALRFDSGFDGTNVESTSGSLKEPTPAIVSVAVGQTTNIVTAQIYPADIAPEITFTNTQPSIASFSSQSPGQPPHKF